MDGGSGCGARRAGGRGRPVVLGALLAVAGAAACSAGDEAPSTEGAAAESVTHVRATVQKAPGARHEEMEMAVHPAPTDLPTRAADQVELDDDEIVLGVVVDGRAVAYPVRYLALSEIANDRIGDTPIAPSW